MLPSWPRRVPPWMRRPLAPLPLRTHRAHGKHAHAGRQCSASPPRWCSPSASPGSCARNRRRFRPAKHRSPPRLPLTTPWPTRPQKAMRPRLRWLRLRPRQRRRHSPHPRGRPPPLPRRRPLPLRHPPSPAPRCQPRQRLLKPPPPPRRRQRWHAHASQSLPPIPPSPRCHHLRRQRRRRHRHRLPTPHPLQHPRRLRSAPCRHAALRQPQPVQPTPNRLRHSIGCKSLRASALPPTARHLASCVAAAKPD